MSRYTGLPMHSAELSIMVNFLTGIPVRFKDLKTGFQYSEFPAVCSTNRDFLKIGMKVKLLDEDGVLIDIGIVTGIHNSPFSVNIRGIEDYDRNIKFLIPIF